MDKRTKQYRHLHRWFNKYTRAAAVAGLIVGSLITLAYLQETTKTPIPVLVTPVSKAESVEPVETPPFCKDVISCIRDVGEELGYPNRIITEMIRISRCESNHRPTVKNPNSTATGVFQVLIGTWKYAKCEGSRTNYEDNIRCAYKVRELQGNGAWNASKKCWNQ